MGSQKCFNPRPSLPRGEALVQTRYMRDHILFQPTPLVTERRSLECHVLYRRSSCFNPRPSLPRGEAYKHKWTPVTTLVSTHAPRYREAKLVSNPEYVLLR